MPPRWDSLAWTRVGFGFTAWGVRRILSVAKKAWMGCQWSDGEWDCERVYLLVCDRAHCALPDFCVMS